MTYAEHLRVPGFSYVSVNKGLKHHQSKSFGPKEMAEVMNLVDKKTRTMEVQKTEIVVDLDINDNVIGVEFLVDTDLTYEVLSEQSTPGPYCIHSMFDMTCIPCAHRHLWLLQQPRDEGQDGF